MDDIHMQIENNDAKRNASTGLELVSCSRARTRQLADLSEEMIMEVLLRLPARTLVSLRTVCRSWRNLIFSPDFTRNHLRRSSLCDPILTPSQIAYCTYDDWHGGIGSFSVQSLLDNPSEPIKVARFSKGRYYRIVGSCHGLLCFLEKDAGEKMHAILWNPCTGFTFESPQISGLACFSGFGYDNINDTYKFYATIRKKVPSGFECSARVYTFGPTSSWRKIDDIPSSLLGSQTAYDPLMANNKKGVFFGSSKACTINWSVNYQVVVYFDLGKEIYGHFTLPDRGSDGYPWTRCTHLYVLRDCLSVCYEHMKTQCWIVWQMKEYGEVQSWTKLATIPFYPQLSYSNEALTLKPLYISESDVLLAISPSFTIVLFNLNNGSINFPVIDCTGEGIENYPYLSQCIGSMMACIYHESLVSPNGLQSNSSKRLLASSNPNPNRGLVSLGEAFLALPTLLLMLSNLFILVLCLYFNWNFLL